MKKCYTGGKYIRPYQRKGNPNKNEYMEISLGENWHNSLTPLGEEKIEIRQKVRVRRKKNV